MGKGGATKTEGGKTYIQSNSGMWVDKNSSAGQRVTASVGGSSGSSGGSSGGSIGSKGGSWVDPNIYPKGVAKVGKDGVVHYPDGSLAGGKIQAHFDWSYGRGGGDYRDPNGSGEYNREYDRYMTLKPGDDWTGGSGGYYTDTRTMGAYIDRQAEEARAAQEAALREAYIRNQQAQQALPQQAQLMGGGGMSETALAQMNAQYGNERTSMENAYMGAVSGLEADLNNGLAIDASQYYDRMASLAAQQRQEQLAREQMAMQISESQKDRDWQYKLAAQKAAQKASSGSGALSQSDSFDQNNSSGQAGSAGTFYTAPSLYGNDGKGGSWTPGGKEAYIRLLLEKGFSDEEIQNMTASMGW